jgi:Zn finger protein HypA/HybF involved in hydrogenase expression
MDDETLYMYCGNCHAKVDFSDRDHTEPCPDCEAYPAQWLAYEPPSLDHDPGFLT